jgi:hypothetical protein
MKSTLLACWIPLVAACGYEGVLRSPPPPPPAEPPGLDETGVGDPPDWQSCSQGWRGIYGNLTVHHPDVDPRPLDPLAGTDPLLLDWWDSPSFEQYNPTLDFGQNWWPVDEDLEDDPAYFAVYWHAWLRMWESGDFEFQLGSADDSWVYVNGEPIAERPGIQDFTRAEYSVNLEAGQYPIEVYFAHRQSVTDGFSFRPLSTSDTASICYPLFEEGEE